MTLEKLPLEGANEFEAWTRFQNSPMQRILHNEIVTKVLALRDTLETVTPGQLIETQKAIEAYRFLFGVIHKKDQVSTPFRAR